MDDREIIRMYLARDERAIAETDAAYGAYCRSIAQTIVGDPLDAEECVNDAYLRAWNAIPPQIPAKLSAFLGRITRNLSLNRARDNRASKRGGTYVQITQELEACLSASDDTAAQLEEKELAQYVNAFVRTLRKREQALFLLRYFYMQPISFCAAQCGMTENNAKVTLHRIRKQLRSYLKKEGMLS